MSCMPKEVAEIRLADRVRRICVVSMATDTKGQIDMYTSRT